MIIYTLKNRTVIEDKCQAESVLYSTTHRRGIKGGGWVGFTTRTLSVCVCVCVCVCVGGGGGLVVCFFVQQNEQLISVRNI